jgi:hypothetical protein
MYKLKLRSKQHEVKAALSGQRLRRKLHMLGAALAVVVVATGCNLWTGSVGQTAYADIHQTGFLFEVTLNPTYSDVLVTVFEKCGESYQCFVDVVGPNIGDSTGQAAVQDCYYSAAGTECGYHVPGGEMEAIVNWAFNDPTGCLQFAVYLDGQFDNVAGWSVVSYGAGNYCLNPPNL